MVALDAADWGECRVLLIKSDGIDRYTHQQDVVRLIAESGLNSDEYTVTRTLIIKTKGMSFIEFETPESAQRVLRTITLRQVYLNNQLVTFRKANRDFITGGEEVTQDYLANSSSGHHQPPPSHREFAPRRAPPPSRAPVRAIREYPTSRGIPQDVAEDARSIGIPLDAVVMLPAVLTSDGPILFDEYYRKKKRAEQQRVFVDDYRDHEPPRRSERGYSPIAERRPMQGGRVVMITGITAELQDCDRLQALCGAFGDVRRTKLSFKNREVAFVEMMTGQGAERVVGFLRGMSIWDKKLDFKISKMLELNGKAAGQTNENNEILTKDYEHTNRNRYGGRDNKIRRNINQPGRILHVSNISIAAVQEFGKESVEEELSELFGNKEVIFLANSETQLFCFAGSPEECVRILVEHHYEDFHGRPLRISFSGRDTMPKRE